MFMFVLDGARLAVVERRYGILFYIIWLPAANP
jgi:hypothetical protein